MNQAVRDIYESGRLIATRRWPGVLALLMITATMAFLLFSPGIFLPDLPGDAINVYSVTGSLFMVYLNIALWAKMHNQRLGRYEKAEAWVSSTHKMAGILFIVALIA